MIADLLLPLFSISLAEIGDKTQLTLLCLAAKTDKHLRLFWGAIFAFFIVDGIAVIAGNFIANLIPPNIVKLLSGLLFLGFGIGFIFQKTEENVTCSLKKPMISAFSMILLSEMGDKTQIASAVFASNYNSLMVLFGVMLGLAIISILTIQVGQKILMKINTNLLHKGSGIIFIALGILSLTAIFY